MAANTKSEAEDIANKIALAGYGTVGTDIFIDFEPASKPATVTTIVYNTGGFEPEATVGKTFEKPTIQAFIIGPVDDPASAITQAQKIKELLHLLRFDSPEGTRYSLWQQGGRNRLGDNKNRRPQYSLNFRVHRRYT